MAQAGFTPIKLYTSGTAAAQPLAANLSLGELALNYTDGKIYYKDGTGAVLSFSSGVTTITFGTTGLTPSTATGGAVSVAGTLVAANGGTSFSTYAAGDLVYASAVNTLAKLTAGTNGFVLTLAGGLPTWAASTGGVTSFSAGTTGLTPNTPSTGAIVLAGTLAVANGGTGTATPAIVAGTNITVTGTWPNQTINASGGGGGDVFGPASATDTAIALFDTTTGKLLKNSLVTVSATGAIVAPQVGSTIPFYFANQAAFPSAATYHGALAHSHSDGAMYFAHSSAWIRLLDASTTVTVAQGGTGLATYTIGDTLYASAATTLTQLAIGTAYQISAVNSGGTAPSWQGLSSLIDNGLTAATQGQILYRNASTWVALAPGTNGQVLTTGGAAANPAWATAAAGLTGFTASQDIIAPNATIYANALTATAAVASADIALVPKGVGAFLLAIPDATVTGGNKRGNYAIDFQLVRASAAQVASSNNAGILGGQNNTANATYAVVIGGDTNTASGSYALVHGTNSTANAVQSMAVGAWATSRAVVGYRAFAPNAPIASALGNTQMGFVTVGVQTTDATATILRSNTSVAASTNQYYVPLNGISTFTILISCGITGASNAKAWEFKGAAKKGATENTNVLVGTLTKNVLAADAGASTWDVAVTANTTTGAITITATGQAGTTIRWSATVIATEVSY
jgi:hypothetical protein